MTEKRTIDLGVIDVTNGEAQTHGVELAEVLEDEGLDDGKWEVQLVVTPFVAQASEPTPEGSKAQWDLACEGQVTELWVPGDSMSMNNTMPVARLTEGERDLYKPFLDLLRKEVQKSNSWGDDLQCNLSYKFSTIGRKKTQKAYPEIAMLEQWYLLPEWVRDRLISSFS